MKHIDIDHRWGVRKPLNFNVQIIAEPGFLARGWLTDASVSGAFVRTEPDLDLLASVRILIAEPLASSSRPIDLSGYVVRRDRGGVGLEWWNFSPEDLQLLF